MTDSIARLTAAIENATIPTADVFAPEAVLDATVPNWRFTVHGSRLTAHGAATLEQTLAAWYACV